MEVVYLGSGEFGIECLNALAESSHNLEFIVTGAAQPAGRGRKTRPTSVARWAETHSIPFTETEDANAPVIIDKIAVYRPELIVVIAFGQKVSNELIKLPAKGAVNVHASLLPKYRGAAPINWAIINGETETGISIITLAEKMDAGPICAQAKTEIIADETAGELHDRLASLAAPLLLKTIGKIADGSIIYTEQDNSKATLAPKLKKSDGFLDFSEPAEFLQRKIRGFWPWPGASAVYLPRHEARGTRHGLRVSIAKARVVESSNPAHLPPGALDENLNLICGINALKITKIKPDGSRLMDFKDFVNGRATQPGDLFTRIDK